MMNVNASVGAVFKKGIRVVQAVTTSHSSSSAASSHIHGIAGQGNPQLQQQGNITTNPLFGQQQPHNNPATQHSQLSGHHSYPNVGGNNSNNPNNSGGGGSIYRTPNTGSFHGQSNYTRFDCACVILSMSPLIKGGLI